MLLFYDAFDFVSRKLAILEVGRHAVFHVVAYFKHFFVVKRQLGVGVRVALDVHDAVDVVSLAVADLFDERTARVGDRRAGVLLVQLRGDDVCFVVFNNRFQTASTGHVPLACKFKYLVVIFMGIIMAGRWNNLLLRLKVVLVLI